MDVPQIREHDEQEQMWHFICKAGVQCDGKHCGWVACLLLPVRAWNIGNIPTS